MAKKQVIAVVKIQLPAGGASPAPPVGTALGPHGIQTMDFVKQYNDATADRRGEIVPVEITIFNDRSFDFKLKTPPAPVLIREAAKIQKGASNVGTEVAGTITKAQVEEIAKKKMPDLNTNKLESAMLQIEGTARSMGVKVEA